MSPYLFAIWIALSSCILLLFFYAAIVNLRRRQAPEIGLEEVIPFLLPVNIEALSQLLDRTREEYSRHTFSREEFQKLHDKRLRLAGEYLRRMSYNAALLQRVGYSQLNSNNPLVAEQAQALIDAGVHVRLYTFMGMFVLYVRRIFRLYALPFAFQPRSSRLPELMRGNLIPAYESLRYKAESLTTIRNTGFHDALAQGL
ncbi:MAG TPA: hypothetical protein VKZ53_11000 [Candidatus Angelobacter sp.]|nr:hypothetical protein [Candidatus Angelobacter sp.]